MQRHYTNGDGSVPPESHLLRPADAARFLAVSERTLWGISNAGQLPYCKIGASRRYRVSDLEAYAAAQIRTGGVR